MLKTTVLIFLAVFMVLAAWAVGKVGYAQAAPAVQANDALTLADLENAEYRVQYTPSRTAKLTDGVYEDATTGLRIVLTDDYAFGDLNGDGIGDAVAILAATINNSAPFLDLVALVNQEGQTAIGGLILLGEGVAIDNLAIVGGRISVDYRRPRAGDTEDSPLRQVTQHFFSRRGLLIPEQTKSFGQLFPYQEGTRYGYINVLGEFAIESQFVLAGEFSEGMAPVSYDGRNTGFINQIGELVIEPRFSYAGAFHQGLAVVGVPGMDADVPFLTTYVDRVGRFVFGDQRFFAAEPFSEGLAAVSYDGEQYGFIDLLGNLAIELQFANAKPFSEGLAPVQFGGHYGFIDHGGRFVIDPQFEAAEPFNNGLAQVVIEGKTGYINQRGDFVIEPTFDYGADFAEGRALVAQAGQLFYIDGAGNRVIEVPNLIQVQDFAEGLAAVVIDDHYGFIDLQGALVIPPQFTYAGSFQNGLAVVETATTWGLVNSIGEVVIEVQRFEELAAKQSFAPQTAIIEYAPAMPEETRPGTCSSNSELLALESAWKCTTADGDTFDPCLTSADGATIVCDPSPMENYAGFRLDLTEPLPDVAIIATPPSPIWQVRTADNDFCRVNRVNTLTVDTQPVTHLCADGLALLGPIDRSNALWTVEKGTLVNNAEGVFTIENRQRVAIVTAWTPIIPKP